MPDHLPRPDMADLSDLLTGADRTGPLHEARPDLARHAGYDDRDTWPADRDPDAGGLPLGPATLALTGAALAVAVALATLTTGG